LRIRRERWHRLRQEEWHSGDELKDMLRHGPRRAAAGLRRLHAVHHSVYLSILHNGLPIGARRRRDGRANAPAVPQAADIIARDDLDKTTSLDMSNLDEPRIEEENVGLVEGDLLSVALPFDGGPVASRVSVSVNVHAEF
jgi:hypothetical protein